MSGLLTIAALALALAGPAAPDAVPKCKVWEDGRLTFAGHCPVFYGGGDARVRAGGREFRFHEAGEYDGPGDDQLTWKGQQAQITRTITSPSGKGVYAEVWRGHGFYLLNGRKLVVDLDGI